jgi:hypothetical protein
VMTELFDILPDDEIHKREHGPYQYKDIISVLETRVYRKKPALCISDKRREKVYSGGEEARI